MTTPDTALAANTTSPDTAGIEGLKAQLPDYAKDIRLNLSAVIKPDPNSGLTPAQVAGIALASAYATRHPQVIAALEAESASLLPPAEINAARAAATIMAMNNVYYRFVHLVEDQEFSTMPAGLRMNVIANSGIDKTTFELYSLAVSAINGCGMCMHAHAKTVQGHAVTKAGVQHAVRIAAVITAAAQALSINA